MTWSALLLTHARRSSSTPEDRRIKALQQEEYVRDLWITLGSVLAFLIVVRIIWLLIGLVYPSKAKPRPSQTSEKSQGDVQPGRNGRISWRRAPIALVAMFRIIAFRLHIPIGPRLTASVSELAFISGYIAVIFALLFINTHGLSSFWYEDRAAHYASSQLPLIVALAGKNNIISFCTGIGHEKLNILHRAAARTCLILLWIHAISRVVNGLSSKFDFTHVWMQYGAVGLTAFTLATILSIRPIRKMFFELFLVGHIVLIAIFLLFGYLHARDPGFGDYIWPALILWAFDRLLRLSRIILNNRIGWKQNQHESTASVELLSQDTIRLTMRRRMNWKPGQHAYVILPTVSDLPSEAHPFTIASIPNTLDGMEDSQEKEVSFIIRGRNGFTGRLREHASGSGDKTVPALIDGPYGCPPDLTVYETCILIAGGSGVSFILPLLLNLVHQARVGKSSVGRVIFIWSVREPEHIKWISKILNQALDSAQSTSLTVDARIYITGPNYTMPELPASDLSSRNSDNGDSIPGTPLSPISEKSFNEKQELPVYSTIRLTHGRPSISRILQEEISASSGPVSVDVAGPSALSQAVSSALASRDVGPVSVLKGAPSVSLHVEVFGM